MPHFPPLKIRWGLVCVFARKIEALCLQRPFVEVGEALGLYLAILWVSDLQLDNMDFTHDSKKWWILFKEEAKQY